MSNLIDRCREAYLALKNKSGITRYGLFYAGYRFGMGDETALKQRLETVKTYVAINGKHYIKKRINLQPGETREFYLVPKGDE